MLLSEKDVKQEKINEKVYNMSPSADFKHGIVNLNLYKYLSLALRNTLCLVFAENLDWVFDKEKDDYVIPDVMILCDRKNIKKGSYFGIPKFIAETISPSTALKDKTIKKEVYEKFGVLEYWIIDVRSLSIEIYHLINGKYQLINIYTLIDDADDQEYNKETVINLFSFPNINLTLSQIFENVKE